jgi:ankyrin repeat protein
VLKKAGVATRLLILAFFAYAQDRYPIDNENPEVLKVLRDAGVNFEYPNSIMYAEAFGPALSINAPLEVFQKLLELGVSVEPEFNGYISASPLMGAVHSGNFEAVDFFIKNGADVNRIHSQQRTPIFFAVVKNNPHILERLIQAGTDINRKDEFGYTPLHHAASSRLPENIRILLSAEADINAKADDGSTPLIAAVDNFMAEPETVRAILAGRPNINAVNNVGQSALISAAANAGNPEIITILLNAGADAKIEDNTGRTALGWFDMNHRINRSPVRRELRDAMQASR